MNWIEQFGPYALFLASFLEFLGIPFPGSILLMIFTKKTAARTQGWFGSEGFRLS